MGSCHPTHACCKPPLKHMLPGTGVRSSTCPSQSSSSQLHFSSDALVGSGTAGHVVESLFAEQTNVLTPAHLPTPTEQVLPLLGKDSSICVLQLPSKPSHSFSTSNKFPFVSTSMFGFTCA